MEVELITKMVFQAVGGLGIFLLGMRYMSDGIQTFASHRLRQLITAATSNRFMALTVGVVFTCLVQSSSVTTVMAVGLVNSGVMSLLQAIGVIMGANIGTTITGWILVIKIGKYGLPILGAASFFFLFSKGERLRSIAMSIMGIGMIFFGLELMKNGFAPIKSIPAFNSWFSLFDASSFPGIIKCAIAGCIITFIVQSSSATIAITMGLAFSGVINFESAAAFVLGENLGTTITAYLASLGATSNAKRASYAHIIFNVVGVAWIITLFPFYIFLVKQFIGVDPGLLVITNGQDTYPHVIMGIAAAHTGFNVVNTILFFPLVVYIKKLLVKMVPEKPFKEEDRLTLLNTGMLDTPLIAIESSHVEIKKMGKIDREMMNYLKDAVGGETVNKYFAKKIFRGEEDLDIIQNEISIFLTNLLALGLPHEITDEGRQQLNMADEYESISDYIVKILKLHLRLRDVNLQLPKEEKTDIFDLHEEVSSFVEQVNHWCANKSTLVLPTAHNQSEAITRRVRKIRMQHINRLSNNRGEPIITMIFTDMINSYRRVKDHALNIVETLARAKI